jgi:hypothetical protein
MEGVVLLVNTLSEQEKSCLVKLAAPEKELKYKVSVGIKFASLELLNIFYYMELFIVLDGMRIFDV